MVNVFLLAVGRDGLVLGLDRGLVLALGREACVGHSGQHVDHLTQNRTRVRFSVDKSSICGQEWYNFENFCTKLYQFLYQIFGAKIKAAQGLLHI